MEDNEHTPEPPAGDGADQQEEKKAVLETMLEVEEKVLDKLEKSKFPNSVHENAQRTEIIIAKKIKVDVLKESIDDLTDEA